MKLCVINGSRRGGSTEHAAKLFKAALLKQGPVEFIEFYLPKDMPEFCVGCFNCFFKGQEKCPHARYTLPMLEAMREADGLLFTTPVYVLAESAQMKAMLDHFGTLFMVHRPMPEMFSKVAMVISTTAGAGTRKSIGTVARSLRYWGVRRIRSCGMALYAVKWEEMKPQKRARFEKKLADQARAFYREVSNRERLPVRLWTRMFFAMMRKMVGSDAQDNLDRVYWQEKGWLGGGKPW